MQSLVWLKIFLPTSSQAGTEKCLFAGYDMSPFIRRYAKYLGEKSTAYRGTAMDFCKVKRGSVRDNSREQTDRIHYSGKMEEPCG